MKHREPRILFVCHHGGRTGAPLVLLRLCKWLRINSKLSFDVLMVFNGELKSDFAAVADKVVCWESFTTNRLKVFWTRKSKRHQIDCDKYDLIYSNTLTNGTLLESLNTRCPIITHVHELAYWAERSGQENLAAVKRQTVHYIAASHAVADYLGRAQLIDPALITTVHEFTELLPMGYTPAIDVRKQLGYGPDAIVIVGSGWEFWRKGRDLIPQLLVNLKRHVPEQEINFLWVGQNGSNDEEANIRFDLARLGISHSFRTVGLVRNPLDYFAASDIFVLLSRDDPFPLVCLEAAMLQKPICCFEGSGGMPELVRNGCGHVAPYLDVEDLARGIAAMILNPLDRIEKGRAARSQVVGNFITERCAPRILEVINNTIAARLRVERSSDL